MKINKKGISLIVLAITIIVMIILATSIILSLSSNDMVNRAKEATSANDLANAKQLVRVAEAEWQMDEEELKKVYSSFEAYAEAKLVEAGFNVSGGTGSLEVTDDANVYVYPTIPEGFTASQADGENKVSKGLVIYQTSTSVTKSNLETAQKSYNQYVWVPVLDISEFERIDWKVGTGYTFASLLSYSSAEALEYVAMKASVEKYGGFYIGRYEAGKDSETLVIRKEAQVWNNSNWTNAKEKAATLSTDTAVSHLVYGEEWDAALKFISVNDPLYVTNSAGKGWYQDNSGDGNPTYLTGIDVGTKATNKLNNIYDMAGNMWEWTVEYNNGTSRVNRGGSYAQDGSVNTAALRNTAGETASNGRAGFRVAIYIK